jgi:hypothetical protein
MNHLNFYQIRDKVTGFYYKRGSAMDSIWTDQDQASVWTMDDAGGSDRLPGDHRTAKPPAGPRLRNIPRQELETGRTGDRHRSRDPSQGHVC